MASLHKRSESGYWYIHYRDNNGRPQRISTKKKLRSEAELVKRKWEEQGSEALSRFENLHLSEFIPEVINYVDKNLPRSKDLYRQALNNFLRLIEDKSVKVLNVQTIEDFKSLRGAEKSKRFPDKNISDFTVNKEIRTIKAAFNIAKRISLIKENNISEAQQKKISITKKRKRFTRDEINIFIPHIKYSSVYRAAMMSRYTGMRLNEIVNAQLKDVNFQNLIISIYNKPELNFETKTGEERDIPINDTLLRDILEWHNIDHEFTIENEKITSCRILSLYDPQRFIVCKEDGSKYTKGNISEKFTKHLKKLNIEGHFHCLRHTFASELAESGADIETMRDLLGHSNYETTKIYIQTGDEVKRKAVNNL